MEFDCSLNARGGEIAHGICRYSYPGIFCGRMASIGRQRPLPSSCSNGGNRSTPARCLHQSRSKKSGGLAWHEQGAGRDYRTAPLSQSFRDRESAIFEKVLEIAERFSPRVEALAGPLNGYAHAHILSVSLLIDRTGTETLFGDAEQYARKLKAKHLIQEA